MKTVKLRLNKVGTTNIQFIKVVMKHTGWGLKDSKEWLDRSSLYLNETIAITVATSIGEFKREILEKCPDFDISFDDIEKQRQLKLIGLGLGDSYDKIEILAEELGSNLAAEVRKRPLEHIAIVSGDFFKDFLLTLNSEQLDELINKHIQEQKTEING
jgi:hypothetical protein